MATISAPETAAEVTQIASPVRMLLASSSEQVGAQSAFASVMKKAVTATMPATAAPPAVDGHNRKLESCARGAAGAGEFRGGVGCARCGVDHRVERERDFLVLASLDEQVLAHGCVALRARHQLVAADLEQQRSVGGEHARVAVDLKRGVRRRDADAIAADECACLFDQRLDLAAVLLQLPARVRERGFSSCSART